MTIASAFNEITVAHGGTASKSGSIAGAIDKLNDVLAGSDQPGAETIEQAIRLLGQHIGGGSSVTVEALTATENKTYTAPSGKAYSPVTVNVSGGALGGLQFGPMFYALTIAQGYTFDPDTLRTYNCGGYANGDSIVIKEDGSGAFPFIPAVASGLSVIAAFVNSVTIDKSYDVTITENMTFGSVTEIELEAETIEADWLEDFTSILQVKIPELAEGHYLFLHVSE